MKWRNYIGKRQAPNRRAWLVSFLLCVLATATWSEEIVVGRLYEPDLVALMKELAAEYQAAHPDVTIRVLDTEAETDLTTYETEVGPLPDIFTLAVHTYKRVHELPYCVSKGLIVPVEDLVGTAYPQESGHFASLWRCVEFQGQHWGTPYYAESYGLLMKHQNVTPEIWDHPPQTWDELKTAAASLTKDEDNDGKPEVWGLLTESREDLPGFWVLLAAQLGTKFCDSQRFTIASDPALVQAYGLLAELRDSKAMKPRHGGKCGFTYVQSWQFNDDIVRTSNSPPQYWSRSTEYKVLPLPGIGNGGTMPVLNVYLAVKKTSPEKQVTCWEFIRWATSPEPQTKYPIVKWGFLPIHDSVAASPEFQDRVQKMPHLAVFTDTLKKVMPVFPYGPGGDQAFGSLGKAFQKAIEGDASIEEALGAANQEMNQLARPGI